MARIKHICSVATGFLFIMIVILFTPNFTAAADVPLNANGEASNRSADLVLEPSAWLMGIQADGKSIRCDSICGTVCDTFPPGATGYDMDSIVCYPWTALFCAQIHPRYPDQDDTVILHVNGLLLSSCQSLESISTTRKGNTFDCSVKIFDCTGRGCDACLWVIVPYTAEDTLGTLSPGTYTVDVVEYRKHLYYSIVPDSGKIRFNVTPADPTGILAAQEDDLMSRFTLAQNYPNPFNLGTTIEFTLHKPAEANIWIYDILGQCVRKWELGHCQSGMYGVLFDGRGDSGEPLPSGTYFYRLKAGDYTKIRKMVLLK